jgi:pyrroline-5-carboxylate reductase
VVWRIIPHHFTLITQSLMQTLLLVGCGHMGGAMLRPWMESRVADSIYVVTPRPDHVPVKAGLLQVVAAPDKLPAGFVPDVIVLAVKPQILGDVLPAYKAYAASSLFISVAAGKKLSFYESALGHQARVVRAMPNLPAQLGEGATLLVANAAVSEADRAMAENLLAALGKAYWLENENQMDAGTALSGCGPAYFYLLADVLAREATALGLPAVLAQDLARQTLIGGAALWREQPKSASDLYQSIAVKGGMTEAALAALQKDDALKALARQALAAAINRAKVL